MMDRSYRIPPLPDSEAPEGGGGQLAIVAVVADPKVVDRILRHLTARGPPADPAGPPAA